MRNVILTAPALTLGNHRHQRHHPDARTRLHGRMRSSELGFRTLPEKFGTGRCQISRVF
jgi:hypothetical protein